MRLRDAEETTGTTASATSIHRRGPDGTLGDGCGLSVSPSRTRRPRQSLASWYTRLWPDMEHSESYIATRAQISGQKCCWRCVDCSGYTRQGLHGTTPGATGS